LQGEDLATLLRTGGYTVGDGVPVQLRQHVIFALFQCQSGILCIAFAFFQTASNMVTKSVDERIEVTVRRCLDSVETLFAIGIFGIDAIKKKQVKIVFDIYVPKAASARQPGCSIKR
jgi:hypothetical protein